MGHVAVTDQWEIPFSGLIVRSVTWPRFHSSCNLEIGLDFFTHLQAMKVFFLFQFLVRPTHIVIERQEKDIWRTSGRPLPTGDMQGKGKHVPKKSEIVKAQREKKERENPLTFPLYGTYEYVRTCVCNFRTIAPSPLLHFLTLADLRMP